MYAKEINKFVYNLYLNLLIKFYETNKYGL